MVVVVKKKPTLENIAKKSKQDNTNKCINRAINFRKMFKIINHTLIAKFLINS